MTLRNCLIAAMAALLVACAPAGRPLPGTPGTYQITEDVAAEIPARIRESVNSLRAAAGVPPVTLDPQLSQAAARHARDMSAQNRAWWYGSDLSTPISRVTEAGYPGEFVGEIYSETYETELDTLAAWMEDPATRAKILDPRARDLGFGWYQEPSGKIWWTLTTGE